MHYVLALAFALSLAACADSSDLEIESAPAEPTTDQVEVVPAANLEAEATDDPPTASARTAASARTTEQCRERAVEVASWGYGKAMPDHTFAFASPRDPGACFIPLDQSSDQSARGMYRYTLQVDEGGELRDLLMDPAPMPDAVMAAAGARDANGDGVEDVLVVHAGDHAALAFLSDADGWTQALMDNGSAGVFATTIDEVAEFWANPSFPP